MDDVERHIASASKEIAHIANHWCKRIYIGGKEVPMADGSLPAEEFMAGQIAKILRRHFKSK